MKEPVLALISCLEPLHPDKITNLMPLVNLLKPNIGYEGKENLVTNVERITISVVLACILIVLHMSFFLGVSAEEKEFDPSHVKRRKRGRARKTAICWEEEEEKEE